jgi:Flp pilus assembly pilin Flp
MLKNSIALIQASLTNRKGVTAAEYAVLAAGIVLAVSAAAALLGPRIATTLGGIVP